MANITTESGILSVAFSLKSAMSGTGYTNGTQINMANTVALSDAAVTGAYMAEILWAPSTTNKCLIDFGIDYGQFAAVVSGGGSIVNEGWLGTAAGRVVDTTGDVITSVVTAIYVELAASTTSANMISIYGSDNTYFMGGLMVPGDCYLNIYQGQTTTASSGTPNAASISIQSAALTATSGSHTLKFLVVYK